MNRISISSTARTSNCMIVTSVSNTGFGIFNK